MPPPALIWNRTLEHAGDTPNAAWLFSLAEAGARAAPLPTDGDRRDLAGRHGADAARFFARRSVTRHLVARRLCVSAATVEIGYDPRGAPLILTPANGLFCSVAARGDLTAVALADAPVGIDLELVEPGPIPWAVLAPEEQAWLRTQDPAAQAATFLHLWTVKEAYLKARRSGLLADPSRVVVTVDPPAVREGPLRQALAPATWFRSVLEGQAVLAACVVIDAPANTAPAVTSSPQPAP